MKSQTLKKEIELTELFKYQRKDILENCKNCPFYQKNYTCPDLDFEVNHFLKSYKKVILYGKKFEVDKDLLDLKFNKELQNHFISEYTKAMKEEVNKNLLKLEEIVSNSNALLVGKCDICENCLKMENKPCLYPEKAHYSLKSFQIDVNKLLEDVFDEKQISEENKLPEYFIFLGGILK